MLDFRLGEVDRLTLYETWNLGKVEIPPRSHLYDLEPIGIGTPFVESLTGYVGRQGLAHGVMLHKLVAKEILPLFEQTYLQEQNFWANKTCSINGTGKWANDWVRVMSTLTLRKDLEFLTMLPWMNVLSPRGLLRRNMAWCSECYAEWHQHNQIIYTPLIWALEVVTHCPRHHTALVSHCAYCQKTIPFLAPRSRAGYCPYCLHWLGLLDQKDTSDNLNFSKEELERQSWIIQTVGELLSISPKITEQLKSARLVNNLTNLVEQVSDGNIFAFTKKLHQADIQIHRTVIKDWLQGKYVPKLGTLLQLGYYFGVAPLEFFTSKTLIVNAPYVNGVRLEGTQDSKDQRSRKRFDAKAAYLALQLAINSVETPPISLDALRQQLGHDARTLKRHFPEECQILVERYQAYWDNKYKYLETILKGIAASDEDPPPSMVQVARRLGEDHPFLINRFPKLCAKISSRYLMFQQTKKAERLQNICKKIQQAALNLQVQGMYLSQKKVAAACGISYAVFREPEILEAWHEIRRELSLES